MSIRRWPLTAKLKRAEAKWIAHEKLCPVCHSAKSAASRCDKGNNLIAGYVQRQIDLENAEAVRLGVSYAQLMAGGAR